ncbi:ATP-binding protein [Mucilaginibacter sp.]|uniref:ATP-binding protein n=1 Tax=Mucilaginibacter sp. TaxID=1882438 RepID=UPI002636DB44|nr:ATP-binding protein [Mucilaginibacter sp.]
MSYAGKIRLMLALLGASLLLTAIIVRVTYTPAINLIQTARMLEDNLHKKEDYIYKAIQTPENFNRFKTLNNNSGDEALQCIQQFTTQRDIYVLTFNNNNLEFWSGIKFIPQNAASIRDSISFLHVVNGYYEAIKKTEGNFSVIFLIPVKVNYAVQNQYLQNSFAKDLLKDNNIDIADFTDKNTYAIHSTSNTYLFSVKVKYNEINYRFFYFELVIWLLAFIVVCTLVQNICTYLANKGYWFLSFFILVFFIIALRFINLYYNWPNFTYKLDLFNPDFYSGGKLYPTLGDLCINILMISWFSAFLHRQRFKFLKYRPGNFTSHLILIGCIIVLIVTSTALLNIFHDLVINSKISFDVNNVLNLSVYSLCGLLMLCFSFFIFYLLGEVFLTVCSKLTIPVKNQLIIFCLGIILTTIGLFFHYKEFTSFYILWALIVLIRARAYYYGNGRITSLAFAGVVFICSIISSLSLNHFESIKEKEIRKGLVRKLENPNDVTAEYLFKKIEKHIIIDPFIVKYFNDTVHNSDYLKNRFQKLYFDGYLSKYEFKIHEFSEAGQSLSADKNYSIDDFKDMVLYSSFKVSNYFYRQNLSFGYQNYFAILPVVQNEKTLGSIVVELKSKALQTSNYFPELLIDRQIENNDDFKDYSYAFYSDRKLLSQSGSFVYNLLAKPTKHPVKTFIFKDTSNVKQPWYDPFTTYSHLIYKPNERNLIVVSKEKNKVFFIITSVTFFFVILLMFSLIVIVMSWAWLRIKILTITNNKIKWGFKVTFDKILYKTRIQFSMVFTVVITLILVGIITYMSISTQYQTQQDNMIRDKIARITAAFENGFFDKYMTKINEESQIAFDALASSYSSDLVLFDSLGVLRITTQPRIYEYGLIANHMNAKAFINLHKQFKSEYIDDEVIGGLSYKTVYAPLRNVKGETVAFLQLPYFSNEADYKERIGSLLNIMINIYALIFIAIGLFAVIIARQITNPLSFIQQSLSKTIYGKKNEPIQWDRDDEIGALVKEYNTMIAALEVSAARLAQSERESAWREMAKQVAHEIKNPLTPLKLGLQLLEKSWREKDPKFDQKFERFSKSFVEQIESLSQIASEFSAFAKMPDTRMERFNVFDVISQAVTIFKQMDNFKFIYRAPETPFFVNADRDQLLRCFNNLFKNAIEATPPERFGLLEINHEITDRNILLTVKDNGNGIPQNMSEKIFEPNFTTKSSGTGLGLAFVKNSIENAGGKVWFETEQGKGTTFFLSLPAAI